MSWSCMSSPVASTGERSSMAIQVIGRIQFLTVVDLKTPFSCWSSAGQSSWGGSQVLATHSADLNLFLFLQERSNLLYKCSPETLRLFRIISFSLTQCSGFGTSITSKSMEFLCPCHIGKLITGVILLYSISYPHSRIGDYTGRVHRK